MESYSKRRKAKTPEQKRRLTIRRAERDANRLLDNLRDRNSLIHGEDIAAYYAERRAFHLRQLGVQP